MTNRSTRCHAPFSEGSFRGARLFNRRCTPISSAARRPGPTDATAIGAAAVQPLLAELVLQKLQQFRIVINHQHSAATAAGIHR